MKDQSFKDWLQQQIQAALGKATAPAPFILWCDPAREWKELLQSAEVPDTLEGERLCFY